MREVKHHVAENEFEANTKKVLNIVRTAGRRICGSELSRKTQFLKPHERRDILASLSDSQQILVFKERRPSGPPKAWYVAAFDGEGLNSDAA